MTDKQIIIDDQKKTIHRLQDECTEKTNAIIALGEQLKAKEQELENICKAFDIEYAIDEETGNLIGRCNKLYKKEQECEELKKYLNQIRDEELSHLDIEWDEYETSARQDNYSNIITLVERALGEIDD